MPAHQQDRNQKKNLSKTRGPITADVRIVFLSTDTDRRTLQRFASFS